MRAAVQTGIGRMEIRDVEKPVAEPGEIVVRVRAALTCGTDRKILERGHEKFTVPLVMGHEFSGDVSQAGAGSRFHEGDAVMLGLSGPCGDCAACRGGASNRCASPDRQMTWGAFAEYVRVGRTVVSRNVFLKPAELSYAAAAALDPLACVARGLARLSRERIDALLIIGTGAIGLLWIAAARKAGVPRVLAVGRGQERLALARRWGAETYDRDAGETPAESSAVVECVGTPSAWQEAHRLTAPGGTTLFFGGCAPGTAVPLDASRIHYGETTVTGSFHYTPEDAAVARDWLASGAIDPSPLFSGRTGLDGLAGLFEKMKHREGIKYVVAP